jgi:hypothetical protein
VHVRAALDLHRHVGRAIVRELRDGAVQVFVNRPALHADPEGVMRLVDLLVETNQATGRPINMIVSRADV